MLAVSTGRTPRWRVKTLTVTTALATRATPAPTAPAQWYARWRARRARIRRARGLSVLDGDGGSCSWNRGGCTWGCTRVLSVAPGACLLYTSPRPRDGLLSRL